MFELTERANRFERTDGRTDPSYRKAPLFKMISILENRTTKLRQHGWILSHFQTLAAMLAAGQFMDLSLTRKYGLHQWPNIVPSVEKLCRRNRLMQLNANTKPFCNFSQNYKLWNLLHSPIYLKKLFLQLLVICL